MANTLKVIDMVAKEALRIAHEKCSFIGTVYRGYDESYAKKGAKIGDTLRIRNPNQYTRRSGSRIMSVQDQNEATQSLAVATQDGVDMKFNSAELSLSIDELSQRYIEPAMSVLCSGIEGDFIAAMTKATANVVGTAGTVPGASSDVTVLGNARAKLNQYLAPKDGNRNLMLDSVTMASIVNAYKLAFQDTAQVKEAFREGFINRNAMADWYENDRTWVMANTSDVTADTDAAALVTDGGVIVDFHTLKSVANSQVGETFTIAGVYACHPETKAAYNFLQQFTITSLNAASVNVSPTIYLGLSATTAAKQNVCKADGTKLATTDFNAKTCTFVGNASTSYRFGLMYHKEAFAFATADLPLMDDAIKCVRVNQDGLALRVWQGSDIRNDEMLLRIDILYGWLAQRPEWATRIICN
jgi:hypothetical protein